MDGKKYVIFGSGETGRRALREYADETAYFIDNSIEQHGLKVDGVDVKSFREFLEEKEKYTVVIASRNYWNEMESQLESSGVFSYIRYGLTKKLYGGTDDLVYNPYLLEDASDLSEEEWNRKMAGNMIREKVNRKAAELADRMPLFEHVEIETVNRCNGNCDFCPVSKNRDTREYHEMTEQLFQDIIGQLAEISYSGRLALFSNNEPFLDKTIIEKHRYAREKLPKARMHLFTNGTLLRLEDFAEVMKYLDEMVIDNYNQELKLIRPCREIKEYCEEHQDLKEKVTIVLRKPHEILTARGGDAPNRRKLLSYGEDKCILPFTQMVIRPDGKISLCCNDPLGKNTLGDLTKENILDVWYGDRFTMVRKCLLQGRKHWKHCEYCDAFNLC